MSESITAKSILVFIPILSAGKNLLGRSKEPEPFLGFCGPISLNFLSGIRIPPDPDLAPPAPIGKMTTSNPPCTRAARLCWQSLEVIQQTSAVILAALKVPGPDRMPDAELAKVL
jgi:hypothetical protein